MHVTLSLRDRVALAARAITGSLPTDPKTVGGRLLAGVIQAGGYPPTRGTREVLAGYGSMPWLRAVVSRISDDVAATVWLLFVKRRQGGKLLDPRGKAVLDGHVKAIQRAPHDIRKRMIKAAVDAGDLEPVLSHQFLDLLATSNPYHVGLSARRVTQQHLDLVGEAFWLIERDGRGMPIAYWPVAPSWILGTPTVSRPFYRVSFRAWQGIIPAAEIIWFCDLDPANPYGRGVGTAQALSDELETDEYACHSADTQCLTRRGWVDGLDVTAADEVATWDEAAGRMEYQRPSEVMSYDVDGQMHHWTGRSVDALVTPNHRMWVRSRLYRRPALPAPVWHFETSAQAMRKPGRPVGIRDAAEYDGGQRQVVFIPAVARVTKRRPGSRGGGRPPRRGVGQALQFAAADFARFLGYYVSEGHASGARACLGQKAGRYVEDIRASLAVFPSEWVRETAAPVGPVSAGATALDVSPEQLFHRWEVSHLGLAEWLRAEVGDGAYQKRLPSEVFEWPREAQRELLEGLMRGDGALRESGLGRHGMYVTRSVGLADDVQRLCCLLGYSTRLSSFPNGKALMCQVSVRYHAGVRTVGGSGTPNHIEAMPYRGKVWCVTVPNGTVVTRRNGCILVSGNSKHVKAYFYNRARPDLIVSPKLADGEAGMGEDEVRRLEEGWTAKSSGFWRAFKPFFLRRPVEIKELDQNLRAQQFVQLREFERNTCIQVFGTSPELFGIIAGGANRATITIAEYIYGRRTLVPRLELQRTVMQERLLPEFDERLILDYVSPVARDAEQELAAAQVAPWALTIDEWRSRMGEEALPDGQGTYHVLPATLERTRFDEAPGEMLDLPLRPMPAVPGALPEAEAAGYLLEREWR